MIDTGLIIEVKIEDANGLGMGHLDFSLDFYLERDNMLHFDKSELVRVLTDEEPRYFALIDSASLGRGNIMCRVNITDKEQMWENGERNVTITSFTGYTIGCCVCGEGETKVCNGYTVSFMAHDDIPKSIGTNTLCGVLKDNIRSFEELTEDMVVNANLAPMPTRAGGVTLTTKTGEKILVLVPENLGYVALKDNGFGRLVQFSESIMGCNGDVKLNVNGIVYDVYGEFSLVDGRTKILIYEY